MGMFFALFNACTHLSCLVQAMCFHSVQGGAVGLYGQSSSCVLLNVYGASAVQILVRCLYLGALVNRRCMLSTLWLNLKTRFKLYPEQITHAPIKEHVGLKSAQYLHHVCKVHIKCR